MICHSLTPKSRVGAGRDGVDSPIFQVLTPQGKSAVTLGLSPFRQVSRLLPSIYPLGYILHRQGFLCVRGIVDLIGFFVSVITRKTLPVGIAFPCTHVSHSMIRRKNRFTIGT